MKLIAKEQQGDIMLLTFRDTNGDIIVQPVALDIWKKVRRVRINDWRKQQRRRDRDFDYGVGEYIEDKSEMDMLSFIPDPVSDLAEKSDLVRRIYEAIEVLPEVQKRRVKAYLIDGLTYRQIAELEKRGKSPVSRSIQQATEKIRKSFV